MSKDWNGLPDREVAGTPWKEGGSATAGPATQSLEAERAAFEVAAAELDIPANSGVAFKLWLAARRAPLPAVQSSNQVRRSASDKEILDWAERHDIQNNLGSCARAAFEDAESLHMTFAESPI